MANILIIEDEFIISDDLSETLQESGHTVVGIAENVNEALELLKQHTVDLVLLDINLNQPVDGVQIAHILNADYQLPFVYVTAFVDAATLERVKHTKPFGYVTKPYNDIDLKIAVDLALSKKSTSVPALRNQTDKPLFVKTRKGLEKIDVNEIRWLEAYDYYAYVRLSDEKVLVTVTLKELEQKIQHPSFVKIHRKYIVNLDHIDLVVGNQVEVAEELLPVSRSHREALLRKLQTI